MPGRQNICGTMTSGRSAVRCRRASASGIGAAAAIAAWLRSAGNRHWPSGVT